MGLEDPVLLGRRQPGVERQHLEAAQPRRGFGVRAQRVGDVVDLALAAEEDEHVAVAFGGQLVDGVDHRPNLVAIVVGSSGSSPPNGRYRTSTG